MTFRRASSALVLYQGLTQTGLDNVPQVAADMARLYWDGKWTAELVVVTEVIAVASGTALTATVKAASAELRASAQAGIGPDKPIDLAGKVEVATSKNLGLKWTGTEITPFYRVFRLKTTWRNKLDTDYGPRQPGRGAVPTPIPPKVIDDAQASPESVIEDMPAEEQPLAVEDGIDERG